MEEIDFLGQDATLFNLAVGDFHLTYVVFPGGDGVYILMFGEPQGQEAAAEAFITEMFAPVAGPGSLESRESPLPRRSRCENRLSRLGGRPIVLPDLGLAFAVPQGAYLLTDADLAEINQDPLPDDPTFLAGFISADGNVIALIGAKAIAAGEFVGYPSRMAAAMAQSLEADLAAITVEETDFLGQAAFMLTLDDDGMHIGYFVFSGGEGTYMVGFWWLQDTESSLWPSCGRCWGPMKGILGGGLSAPAMGGPGDHLRWANHRRSN